jgi:hypothetical protein
LAGIVDVAFSEWGADQLRGRNIEAPKPGSRIESDTIHDGGWVLKRNSPALAVEVVHDGTVMQSEPIDVQRPDISAAFPEVLGGDKSRVPLRVIRVRHSGHGEEQYSGSTVQDASGPVTRFFDKWWVIEVADRRCEREWRSALHCAWTLLKYRLSWKPRSGSPVGRVRFGNLRRLRLINLTFGVESGQLSATTARTSSPASLAMSKGVWLRTPKTYTIQKLGYDCVTVREVLNVEEC